MDIENLIYSSYYHNRIEHVECTREEAEAALAELQCDEGYESDTEANGTIEVWGDHHTQMGSGTWRIHLDMQDQ